MWAALALSVVVLVALGARRAPASGTSAARLDGIAAELRCLQCTGESVAGSQAPIAVKMRDEILRQARAGATDDEIYSYFVDRYGPRVLLNPPSTGVAGLIWVLPVVVVCTAAAGVATVLARWRAAGRAEAGADGAATPGVRPGRAGDGPRPAWRTPAMGGAVVLFAVLAGVLVANSSGQRQSGDTITGGGPDADDPAAECRAQAMARPEAAIGCYDDVLAATPDDPESLTYRGWARYRTGDTAGAAADFARVVEVDPTFPDVYVFRAVQAKDEGRFLDARASLDRLDELDAPAQLVDTMRSMGLELQVAEGLLAPDTRACWTREKAAIAAVNAALAASVQAGAGAGPTTTLPPGSVTDALTELVEADKCLAAVLVARPDDVDALVMRGLAISVLYQVSLAAEPDAAVLGRALEVLGRAVELAPDDPDPRLIRAAVANMSGDPRAAAADLDVIGDRSPSPLYASIDVDTIRRDVEAQLREG